MAATIHVLQLSGHEKEDLASFNTNPSYHGLYANVHATDEVIKSKMRVAVDPIRQ